MKLEIANKFSHVDIIGTHSNLMYDTYIE